jgi:hypothetical protein
MLRSPLIRLGLCTTLSICAAACSGVGTEELIPSIDPSAGFSTADVDDSAPPAEDTVTMVDDPAPGDAV